MAVLLIRVAVATLAGVVCLFMPYLPGRYDPIAAPLSVAARVVGTVGLVLVPIGGLWLAGEVRGRRQPAMFGVIASTGVGAMAALAAAATASISLGVILAGLSVIVARDWNRRSRLRNSDAEVKASSAPLALIVVPATLFLCQYFVLPSAVDAARRRVVANSAPLVADIEESRRGQGRFPTSLHSVGEDYNTGLIGVDRYRYEPQGEAYNLFFELPSPAFGTQEFVVYNPLDEQTFTSHNRDLLEYTGAGLEAQRGFYAADEGPAPHWKQFLFD